MMEKFLDYPPWYAAFSYTAGALGIIISAFYLYASILLLQRKTKGLKMFYAAVIVAMVFVIARGVGVAMSLSGMIIIAEVTDSIISLVINGV